MVNFPGRCVKFSLIPILLLSAALAGVALAQAVSTNRPARARGFSLPYKKEGKTIALFTGAEHKPLSVTLMQIREFRVETYNPDGTPNLQGEAPNCLLDISTKRMTSDGPLKLSQAGGAFTLSGVGFAWDQESERLQLSNRVEATFRLTPRPSSPFFRP